MTLLEKHQPTYGELIERIEALEAIVYKKKPKSKALVTEDQEACRNTWKAYAHAYGERYGVQPIRNAKVNKAIKDFVTRVGASEAPEIAAWYVWINERFVIGKMHDVGLLLANAEGYRTQWATGRTMTQTRAVQADRTQANASVVSEGMSFLRQRGAIGG